MSITLPTHHHGLVIETIGDDHRIQKLPVPQPEAGAAIVQVLAANILSYLQEIYNGTRPYSFPKPLVGGTSAVGRISAVGNDAVALKLDQLVWVDCCVRARDDPATMFLSAIHEGSTEGTKKLMKDVWRDGVLAQYVKVPLENCIPLNESRLVKELGYSFPALTYMANLLVPFGGLRDIELKAGETVVVCPATGSFGGAGVQVAVAMGARVIAMGRNGQELARLKVHIRSGTPNADIEVVEITGDEAADVESLKKFGTIDAVLDLSPPQAAKSTHTKCAMEALRRGGRCSLMGFPGQLMSFWKIVGNDITMKGKLMYERSDMVLFVKMLERGLFPRQEDFVDMKCFALEDWKDAFAEAAKHTGIGRAVAIEM